MTGLGLVLDPNKQFRNACKVWKWHSKQCFLFYLWCLFVSFSLFLFLSTFFLSVFCHSFSLFFVKNSSVLKNVSSFVSVDKFLEDWTAFLSFFSKKIQYRCPCTFECTSISVVNNARKLFLDSLKLWKNI